MKTIIGIILIIISIVIMWNIGLRVVDQVIKLIYSILNPPLDIFIIYKYIYEFLINVVYVIIVIFILLLALGLLNK